MNKAAQSLFALLAVLLLSLGAARPATTGAMHRSPAAASATTVALTLPDVVIPPGAEVVLELALRQNPGNVKGVDLQIAYNTAVAELVNVARGSIPTDWVLMSNAYANGKVEIGLAGVTSPAGDVALVRLTFRALAAKGASTVLAFQEAQVNEQNALGSARDGQITIDTPPVTDLSGSVTGGQFVLSWSHVGADVHHYEVWRAFGSPYFTPGAGGVCLDEDVNPGGTTFSDPNSGLGTPGTGAFYLVRGVDVNGRPSPTYNRMGIFNFGIQAGSGP
jgi:hypothetical protein